MQKDWNGLATLTSKAKLHLYIIGMWLLLSPTDGTQAIGQDVSSEMILSAKITKSDTIEIRLDNESITPKPAAFTITPELAIHSLHKKAGTIRLHTATIDLTQSYSIKYKKSQKELQPDGVLDEFSSVKELGCTWNEDHTIFRVFAPRATRVTLVLFDSLECDSGIEHAMERDIEGVWECLLPGQYLGKYYCYKVAGPQSPTELFDAGKLICDPYSKAVATKSEYLHHGKTLILDTASYDWEGDTWLKHKWEDLIIYECHVRDMTAHLSSGVDSALAGSYKGLVQHGIRGGIEHIKSLGVNAVEFLPLQDFSNVEIPYEEKAQGQTNNWNPYARNHWGYMTSYFFAPESYYASGGTMQADHYCGDHGQQVFEFKDVVKAFHKEGIAVILDVVYNHVATYDQNCFKLLDKKYYFRLDDNQNFTSASGCGNDFKTERPMAQRLILDSIKYWLTEYHVDGFRFDLAAMIDWETIDEILKEARDINPDVIIVAEPWGGGKYEPAKFSSHGWAAWNDQFRNGVKGQNPENGQSFIFGRWWQSENIKTIQRYVTGDLSLDGGLFAHKSHSINYLESHDDYTLGDFIRIGTGEVKPHQVIADPLKNAKLSERQMKINKLAAMILFTSQGPVMISEGQEYARSKVIAPTDVPEQPVGQIDHNSYNKDNETNWLNYQHADLNKELVAYYKGLITLRKKHRAFRWSPKAGVSFIKSENPFALGFSLKKDGCGDTHDFLVLVNAHQDTSAQFSLPEGDWSVVVDAAKAGDKVLREVNEESVTVLPTTGLVLLR